MTDASYDSMYVDNRLRAEREALVLESLVSLRRWASESRKHRGLAPILRSYSKHEDWPPHSSIRSAALGVDGVVGLILEGFLPWPPTIHQPAPDVVKEMVVVHRG